MPAMTPISAAELASIRSDAVAAVCDKTCQIYRHTTNTADGYGSSTPTYTLISTVQAGMSEPTAGELQNYDFIIGDKEAVKVRLPIGTDVTHQDHLVIEGQTLEVHILLNPRSYEIFHSVIAAQIK